MKTRWPLLLFLLGSGVLGCFIAVTVSVSQQLRQDRLDRALIRAVNELDAPGVERLLAEGASANARDRRESPMTLAGLVKRAVARLQKKTATPDINHADTALELLMKDNRAYLDSSVPVFDAMEVELIKHGADIQVRGVLGEPPLSNAAGWRHHRTLDLLISRGADVNARDGIGYVPLLATDDYGANALLEHGADVNATGPIGETALHNAMDVAVARSLIRYGANVNAADKDGYSPLYYQTTAGPARAPIGQLLRLHGARLTEADKVALEDRSSPGR